MRRWSRAGDRSVLGALIAGGAIGFEREYRARPAGLRTHTLVVLTGARWLDRHLPQKNFAEITVRSRRETVIDEAELRRLLKVFDLEGERVRQGLAQGGVVFQLSGPFSGRGVLRLDELPAALRADPRVVEFDIQPRKD